MTGTSKTLILNPLTLFHIPSFHLSSRTFLKIFWLLSLSVLISLLFLVFFQINQLAKETDSLRKLEQSLKIISHNNQNLRLQAATTNRQILAEYLIEEFNFEKVERLHFIKAPETQVATK